jgi:alanine-synthesizing transaminase
VRFSDRTAWPEESELSVAIDEAGRAGAIAWNLTEQNPTRVGLLLPDEGMAEAFGRAALAPYEPRPFGLPSARDAVCEELRAHGAKVSPSQVILTASTSEAYGFLFKLLGDPGTHVLVPTPTYPLIDVLARLEGLSARAVPMHCSLDWHLDLEGLAAAGDDQTRALVVVSPNHPTGSFLKQAELSGLFQLCASRGWALIVDEVFSRYAFGNDPSRVPTVSALEPPVLTFTLGGLSKHAAMPHLKLAWMTVQGPRAQLEQALARLEVLADCMLSVASPVQAALPKLLALAPSRRVVIQQRLEENRSRTENLLRGSPWSLLPPEGGWSAILRGPLEPNEDTVAGKALRAGIRLDPGYFYDLTGGTHAVVSLLVNPSHMEQGLRHLLAL